MAINWLSIFELCSCANFEGSGRVFDQSVCATSLREAWWLHGSDTHLLTKEEGQPVFRFRLREYQLSVSEP